MSGRGLGFGLAQKSSSSLGGAGIGGVKKRAVIRNNHLRKPTILRLARKGGVKRLSMMCYDEINSVLINFLKKIIGDAVIYCEYARRKSITVLDVLNALHKNGKILYGYNNSISN